MADGAARDPLVPGDVQNGVGRPPGRPGQSRAAELAAAGTDVLVLNGDRDPFGIPQGSGKTRVVVLAGETHALSRHPGETGRAAGSWLRELLTPDG